MVGSTGTGSHVVGSCHVTMWLVPVVAMWLAVAMWLVVAMWFTVSVGMWLTVAMWLAVVIGWQLLCDCQ